MTTDVMNPNKDLLAQLINSQEIQNQINKAIYRKISTQTEQAKRELKAYTDHSIHEIKKYIPLNDGEATQLHSNVQSKAHMITRQWIENRWGSQNYGGHDFYSKKFGHIVCALYRILKRHFNAHKYTAILHSDYENALAFVDQMNINDLPSNVDRLTARQLEIVNEWESRHHLALTQPDD